MRSRTRSRSRESRIAGTTVTRPTLPDTAPAPGRTAPATSPRREAAGRYGRAPTREVRMDTSASVRAADAFDRRVHEIFAGHPVESLTQDGGPIHQLVPGFRVHAVAPGPRHPHRWTYVTTGCWAAAHHGHGVEFVLTTR